MTDLTEKQIAEYADDTEIAGWLECYVDLALAQHERGDYINRSYRVALHAHALRLRDRAEIERLEAENARLQEAFHALYSHEGVEAFWRKWYEVGEPHKHGTFESTWLSLGHAIENGNPEKWMFVNVTLDEYLQQALQEGSE